MTAWRSRRQASSAGGSGRTRQEEPAPTSAAPPREHTLQHIDSCTCYNDVLFLVWWVPSRLPAYTCGSSSRARHKEPNWSTRPWLDQWRGRRWTENMLEKRKSRRDNSIWNNYLTRFYVLRCQILLAKATSEFHSYKLFITVLYLALRGTNQICKEMVTSYWKAHWYNSRLEIISWRWHIVHISVNNGK